MAEGEQQDSAKQGAAPPRRGPPGVRASTAAGIRCHSPSPRQA